jgi:hypothetical protein
MKEGFLVAVESRRNDYEIMTEGSAISESSFKGYGEKA